MTKSFIIPNIESLQTVAQDVVSFLGEIRTVCFYGEMGAGKTTFINSMLTVLGTQDSGNSPTFSLINTYKSAKYGHIFHLDLYRINNTEEALDVGVEDVLYNNCWCLIEWPQHVQSLLYKPYADIRIIAREDGTRQLSVILIKI